MFLDKKTLFVYYLAIIGVLLSGVVIIFSKYGSDIGIILQLLIAIIVFLFFRKNFFKNPSIIYLLFFILIILVNFFFHSNFVNNKLIGTLLSSIAAFVIISQLDFYIFKKIWLNVMFIICLYSIIVYFLVINNIIDTTILNTSSEHQFIMSYGNVFGWLVKSTRLSSFYHEPGAFQIYLNFTFILFFKEIIDYNFVKEKLLILLILLISLILTQSTTGYIVFFLIFSLMLFNKFKVKKYIIFYPIIFSCIILLGYIFISSNVIKEKFLQEEENSSLYIRSSDNISMYKMITESPIIGHGLGTNQYENRSNILGNQTSSNGWLSMTASLGIFWFFLFVGGTISALKKMNLGNFFLIILLLIHANENYVHFVVSYIFIFHFYSYNKLHAFNNNSNI